MTFLSKQLIDKQELLEEDVKEIEDLHHQKDFLFELMKELDPQYITHDRMVAKLYANLLESLEYNMQRVWKFEQNQEYHSWWYKIPHCKCPKMDNADPLYSGRRIISGDCVIHNGKPANAFPVKGASE